MNKIIPDGSMCLFKKDSGGTREGKVVLVEHRNIQDSDFGSGYTVKLYHSEKQITEEEWRHKTIILKPQSNDYSFRDITLDQDEFNELKVVGIFICVL
jgi:hypothetical protein